MNEPEESSELHPPQVAEIKQSEVHSVKAETARMFQASAKRIIAEEAGLQQSAVGAVKATSLSAYQSALAAVEAEEVLSQKSVMGLVQAEKASINGYTGAVFAHNAEVHYGVTGLVAGTDIHAENARTIFLIGRKIDGNVTPMMDSRSALIVGLTGGLFAGLLFLLGRVLFGRK